MIVPLYALSRAREHLLQLLVHLVREGKQKEGTGGTNPFHRAARAATRTQPACAATGRIGPRPSARPPQPGSVTAKAARPNYHSVPHYSGNKMKGTLKAIKRTPHMLTTKVGMSTSELLARVGLHAWPERGVLTLGWSNAQRVPIRKRYAEPRGDRVKRGADYGCAGLRTSLCASLED